MADHVEEIRLDVSPLADRVDDIRENIIETQGAVVAMGEVVVQQERESANEICRGVNAGFHALIQSQIGQKIAVHESTAQARLGLMVDISAKIDESRETLLKDYQSIKHRYVALFSGLDRDLKNRITALNKPAVQVAESKKKIVFATPVRQASATLCYARESQMYTLQFISTELKKRTQIALGYLDGNMEEEQRYEKNMGPVLYKSKIEKISEEYIPVVVSESVCLHQQNSVMWDAEVPKATGFAGDVSRVCIESAKQNQWGETSAEDVSKIKEAVFNLPEYSSLESRVALQLTKLVKESDWQTWRCDQ